MTASAPAKLVQHVAGELEKEWPCCSEGCPRKAEYAIAFKGQYGHVHDCGPHTAQLLEFCDVEYCSPLPCPIPVAQHNTTWDDRPKPLGEEECPPSAG